MRAENTCDKYRKNRKNNKFNKIPVLERKETWARKFCYHPLLLLKIFPLLWAVLLFMHCSCMLMEKRSIHRLILQYFGTVSNYKQCHVCNWWFQFRESGTHYKITGQERIPVKITITIREKQWCVGVLGPFLALQQFLPILVTLAQFVAFCHICY